MNLKSIKTKIDNLSIVKFYAKYLKKPLTFVGSVLSWTVFVVLLISAGMLIYYFVSSQIYANKGAGYEPEFSLYTIISPSMVPNIEVYDVVIVNKIENPDEIEIGDIISFNSTEFRPGEVINVTHRVVEKMVDGDGNYSFYTKGDNNFVKDPDPVKYESIMGEVKLRIPQLGRVQFFLGSVTGWLLVIVIPALFIIIRAIVRVLKISEIGKNVKPNSKLFPLFKKRLLLPHKNTIPEDNITINIPPEPIQHVEYQNEVNPIDKIYEDLKNISK